MTLSRLSQINKMTDRIKLAEAMGWNNITDKYLDVDTNLHAFGGFPPETRSYGVRSPLPDPFTDANDCEALIQWLNGLGYAVDITIMSSGDTLLISRSVGNADVGYSVDTERWKGDDWKQGVCELALKVLG